MLLIRGVPHSELSSGRVNLPQTCEMGAEARRLNLREGSHTGYQRVLTPRVPDLAVGLRTTISSMQRERPRVPRGLLQLQPDNWS